MGCVSPGGEKTSGGIPFLVVPENILIGLSNYPRDPCQRKDMCPQLSADSNYPDVGFHRNIDLTKQGTMRAWDKKPPNVQDEIILQLLVSCFLSKCRQHQISLK